MSVGKKADRFSCTLLVMCIVLGQYTAYSGTVHTDCSAPSLKSNQTTNSIQMFLSVISKSYNELSFFCSKFHPMLSRFCFQRNGQLGARYFSSENDTVLVCKVNGNVD